MSNLSFFYDLHFISTFHDLIWNQRIPRSIKSTIAFCPRDSNHTFLARDYTVFKKRKKTIHYGLNGSKCEIVIFLTRFSLNLIDSWHPVSLFLLSFSFLPFFFSPPPRECIHKVAVHSASGLNYGSYFLWVGIAGWYPTFVYRSLRYGNVVYIQKFMYSSPSNASSASHHRHHYRATLRRWNRCDWQLLLFRFIISWQLCTRREIEYFEFSATFKT